MSEQAKNIDADEWHVCGVVVQCRPCDIANVKTALLTFELTEISAIDEDSGKLVVVMESANQADLLERMELARNIHGVLALSLVYHQQDQNTLVGE
ncbi:chaperone NapD [Spirabiliibacterium falconis]|uniref:chaperone NapD n=1 Tax=Spirabiliibacterium falconis TaxID=572023 RepID=UPI001AADC47E|nr:chaperone NapD [Spirabiliibacterium falconis]MBE2894620.1 chaperone NapD [Spirabiliibacterium falconis]